MKKIRLHSLVLSVASLSVSCGGSAIDQGAGSEDGAVPATGGSPAVHEPATSGGAATGGATNGTGGRRADGDTGGNRPDEPAMGGMGGEAPVREKPTPIPSAACSLPATVPEDMELDLDFEWGVIPVSLPPGYDGAHPGPIIIAFPASYEGLFELAVDRFGPNPLLDDYVIARPRVTKESSYWEGRPIEDYDTAYREIASQVCFDEALVFGVGNGSGARQLVWMVSQPTSDEVVRPRDYFAMAVVGNVRNKMAPWPDIPLLFIHSTKDETGWQDPDGRLELERRRESQECSEMSIAAGTTTYPSKATYTCEDFTGCTSPLRFCSHDTPTMIDLWQTPHNVEIHRFFADYL